MYRTMEVVKKKNNCKACDQRKLAASENEMQIVLNNEIMMSLLLQMPDLGSFQILKKAQGINSGAGSLLCFQTVTGTISQEAQRGIIDAAKKNTRLLHYMWKDRLYLYLFDDQMSNPRQWVLLQQQRFSNLICYTEEKYFCELSCGMSQYRKKFEDMKDAVKEAELAANSRKERGVFLYRKTEGEKEVFFGSKDAQAAADLILKKGKEEAVKYTGRLMNKVCISDGDETQISLKYGLRLSRFFYEMAGYLFLRERKTGMEWSIQELTQDVLKFYGVNLWEEQESKETVWTVTYEAAERYVNTVFDKMEQTYWRTQNGEKSEAVEMAIQYIRDNYGKNISLEDTSANVGVTRFYLGRLLKQERNQTFLEILTDIRMFYVILLMEKENATNQNISNLVGYSSVEYFQQVFKRKIGISPGEYRRILNSSSLEDKR